MTKKELVAKVAKTTGQPKNQVDRTIRALLDTIQTTLKKKDKVSFVGFGTFYVAKRAARMGRNPQTGKAIKIPAAHIPKFRAGKALKNSVKR